MPLPVSPNFEPIVIAAMPAPPGAAAGLGALDWVVMGVYGLLLVGTGIWLSRRQKGTEDYFLASRKMPAWAVAISVVATALSAATFLGVPEHSYRDGGNVSYMMGGVGGILAALLVAAFFIPAFYRHNVTTVYQLLEIRFGSVARRAASAAFMLGRLAASGARLYIAAHAVAFVLFGDAEPGSLLVSIAVLTLIGVLYTAFGGIETVIWTDVVQTVVMLLAIGAVVVLLLNRIPADAGQIVQSLSHAPLNGQTHSKLTLLDWSLDPGAAFGVWASLTGVVLLNAAAYGTDHDLAQRTLTCKSALKGSASIIAATLITLPVTFLFLLVGLLLHVYYQRPELMAGFVPAWTPTGTKDVFLGFIVHELPAGMSGLVIAGIVAVTLSSLDSALNAMSATLVNDFYKPMRPGRTERHYLFAARAGVVFWGLALGGFAAICVFWQENAGDTFIELAMKVMVYAFSGLLAVFCAAIFTRRGTSVSVVCALAAGVVFTVLLDPMRPLWTGLMEWSRATPGVDDGWKLGEQAIAFPWVMLVSTALCFAVCILPPGRRTALRDFGYAATPGA